MDLGKIVDIRKKVFGEVKVRTSLLANTRQFDTSFVEICEPWVPDW